jgi:hypothetical protein
MLRATLITSEDDLDLSVSFGLEPSAAQSLTLLRSPQYEHLLADEDRGTTIAHSGDAHSEPSYIKSVTWVGDTIEFVSTRRNYTVDVSRVEAADIADAKRVLALMNKDGRFSCSIA